MEQVQSPVVFKIQIEEHNNFTWQGKLTVDEQVIVFKSEMELLLAINNILGGDQETSCLWNISEQ